ncbi:uncharacterized protein A1O9_08368, partial [Exophiala aquamarina CBS 119918]
STILTDSPMEAFYNSDSNAQTTVQESWTAYSKYRLRPQVLVDMSQVDTSTINFRQTVNFPLYISPAGTQAMAHPDGELATTRACARRRVHMGISSFS